MIEVNPTSQTKASVIWLHGLGADGHDFAPIVSQLQLPDHLGVRFLFPHAPIQPVTLNGGMPMPAWFDLYSLDADAKIDWKGIKQAQSTVEQLIDQERDRGIPDERIILVGFSQGGAVVLYTGLSHARPLAGIMALSIYLSTDGDLIQNLPDTNKQTPIFMAHGQHDEVVAINLGETTAQSLQTAGFQVDWHHYDMAHGVCPSQIRDMSKWFNTILERE